MHPMFSHLFLASLLLVRSLSTPLVPVSLDNSSFPITNVTLENLAGLDNYTADYEIGAGPVIPVPVNDTVDLTSPLSSVSAVNPDSVISLDDLNDAPSLLKRGLPKLTKARAPNETTGDTVVFDGVTRSAHWNWSMNVTYGEKLSQGQLQYILLAMHKSVSRVVHQAGGNTGLMAPYFHTDVHSLITNQTWRMNFARNSTNARIGHAQLALDMLYHRDVTHDVYCLIDQFQLWNGRLGNGVGRELFLSGNIVEITGDLLRASSP
ncbi:MAG: hypothetical protein M1828_004152 [Chrysothrix sp. TS-e1954]|nr:MAG: hypothetical protein M1828_004152 [Chrysothrix sp. TS-e1954]